MNPHMSSSIHFLFYASSTDTHTRTHTNTLLSCIKLKLVELRSFTMHSCLPIYQSHYLLLRRARQAETSGRFIIKLFI
jgi:hypothetical protein